MELNEEEIEKISGEVRRFLDKYTALVKRTQPPEDTEDIRAQLKALPALIYFKSREKEEAESKLQSIKARIAKLETAEFLRIRGKTGEKGKPKFTIEDSHRKARFALKQDSNEYRDLKRLEDEWHNKHRDLKDEKNFLINNFEALKTLVLDELGTALRRPTG